MFHRQENAGENRDACVEKKARREAVAEKQERAQGGNDRLNVQDHIHDRWVAVLEGESEKDRAHGRASEPGEEQVTPGACIDLAQLAEPRNQDRQEHQQDEHVLPEHDHLRVEKIVERNAPRALRPPQSGAESYEPWTVPCARRVAFFHANGHNARPMLRQRALVIELMIVPSSLSCAAAGSSAMTVK